MKKKLIYLLSIALLCCLSIGSFCQNDPSISCNQLPQKPNPATAVNDFANIIDDNAQQKMENDLRTYWDSTSIAVVVVTVQNMNGNEVSDYATSVIEAGGFDPKKVKDFSEGIETTLGTKILKGVIFDKDYRCSEEMTFIKGKLSIFCKLTIIHNRKEIENFLLKPNVLDRAIQRELKKRQLQGLQVREQRKSSETILDGIAEDLKTYVQSQLLSQRRKFIKSLSNGQDEATIDAKGLTEFNNDWNTIDGKLKLVPGKDTLAKFNTFIQNEYGITLTNRAIIDAFRVEDFDHELKNMLNELDRFIIQVPPTETEK